MNSTCKGHKTVAVINAHGKHELRCGNCDLKLAHQDGDGKVQGISRGHIKDLEAIIPVKISEV